MVFGLVLRNVIRLLSMTFGRPAMITKSNDVPLPLLIDDEFLSVTNESRQPAGRQPRFGAFVYSCKLFDLLGEVLDFLSSTALQNVEQNRGSSQVNTILGEVLNLNRKLDDFSQSVPRHLRRLEVTSPYTASASSENHIHLQQRVLHCRYR